MNSRPVLYAICPRRASWLAMIRSKSLASAPMPQTYRKRRGLLLLRLRDIPIRSLRDFRRLNRGDLMCSMRRRLGGDGVRSLPFGEAMERLKVLLLS